jgi:hypothetical protein
MNKKVSALIMTILLLSGVIITALASVDANPNIASASIYLSTSVNATFTLTARKFCNISVYDVKLEVKNSNGTWSFVSWLSSPAGATNAVILNSSKSYASSCVSGKTYRISATFDADGETVSRTSNEATYN